MANNAASQPGPSGLCSLPPAAGRSPDTTEMEIQEIAPGLSDERSAEKEPTPGTPPEDPYSNWTLNLSKRTKRRLAKGEQVVVAGTTLAPTNTQLSTSLTKQKPIPSSIKRRKLPPLPRSDFKIVIRPKKGLLVNTFTNHQVSRAVSQACGNQIDDSKFLVRLRPGSNIIIISTPYQEVADVLRKITQIVLEGANYLVNSYVAAPDGVSRGVVHGLDPNTPTDELMAHLRVRTQGVEILQARMLGKTKTAVITFSSPTPPRWVYYYGGETACYPYKPSRQVCQVCQSIGHRSDVCPTPDIQICLNCGTRNPDELHTCSPRCAACGEGHNTGARECQKRLKPDTRRRRTNPLLQNKAGSWQGGQPHPPGQTKPPQHLSRADNIPKLRCRWFSTDRETSSHSRSRSRTRSRSRADQRHQDDRYTKPPTPRVKQQKKKPVRKATPSTQEQVSWPALSVSHPSINSCSKCSKLEQDNAHLREQIYELNRRLQRLETQPQQATQLVQPTPGTQTRDARPNPQATAPPAEQPSLASLAATLETLITQQQQFAAQIQAQTQTSAELGQAVAELQRNARVLEHGSRKRVDTINNPRAKTYRRIDNINDVSDVESSLDGSNF